MRPETGTVIPDRGGAKGQGWWGKLDPKRKRMFAAAALGGVLAVIYLMTRQSSDTSAEDVPADATDTTAPGAEMGSSGVPGAWDYGGVPSPYPNFPPVGQSGEIGKLNSQIAALRRQWAAWMHQHPLPHPSIKPPPHDHPFMPPNGTIDHYKPPHHKPPGHDHPGGRGGWGRDRHHPGGRGRHGPPRHHRPRPRHRRPIGGGPGRPGAGMHWG